MRAHHRSPLRHALVLLIYAALGLLLTYPLLASITTHVPGDGIDDPALVWNLWWGKFSLVDRVANPFDCDWMFYPVGINLAFYTLTLLNAGLSVPLQTSWALVPTSNVLLLSSFVLGGYGAYLLAHHVLLDCRGRRSAHQPPSAPWPPIVRYELPAFMAGLAYAFSSSKLFYAALGQFNIAGSQWIPFTVLYVLKSGRDRSPRSALLAGTFLVLQAYAELTFASFLLIFIALYIGYELVSALGRDQARRDVWDGVGVATRLPVSLLLRNLALIGVVFALGIMPFLVNMLPDLRAEGDFFTTGGGFDDVFSADLAGYLLPTQLHSLWGGISGRLPFPHDKGQHLYVGSVLTGLAAAGLWLGRRRTAVRFWGLSTLLFFSLTLGPTVRIWGHDTAIPGPFLLLSRLPFFKGNRYPSRYSVLLVLSCALLAAVGMHFLLSRAGSTTPTSALAAGARRRRRWWLFGLLCLTPALFLLEHVSIPLPLTDLRVPSIYEHVAEEQDDFAVLELPIGWRNGARVMGKQDVIIMFEQWYQTAHAKRLLGGNTSRNPELKFQYFARAPVLNSLINIESGYQVPPAVREQDALDAPLLLESLDVRYVVVHEAQASSSLLSYVQEVLPLQRLERDGDIVLYGVLGPAGPLELPDLSTSLGQLQLAEGWSPIGDVVDGEGAVWAQRAQVRLLLHVPAGDKRLRLRAWGPDSGQAVEVRSDGRRVATVPLEGGWKTYETTITQQILHPGLQQIDLNFTQLYRQDEVATRSRPRDPSVLLPDGISSIVVQSAGLHIGGAELGHIYVDGQDLSPSGRGYNVVALAADGTLLLQESFDTHGDAAASLRLAQSLAAMPQGSIVAVSVADEASLNLDEEAVAALTTIGATGDLRGRFRWGHAIIGVKGWPPGQALEELDGLRPVSVHVGVAATASMVAGAFADVGIEALP